VKGRRRHLLKKYLGLKAARKERILAEHYNDVLGKKARKELEIDVQGNLGCILKESVRLHSNWY